jgi:hypothetical protein
MDLADDEDGNDGALGMKRFVRLELPRYKGRCLESRGSG